MTLLIHYINMSAEDIRNLKKDIIGIDASLFSSRRTTTLKAYGDMDFLFQVIKKGVKYDPSDLILYR